MKLVMFVFLSKEKIIKMVDIGIEPMTNALLEHCSTKLS